VACPFFMPVEKLENGNWPHPSRLPLGCGWTGYCTAAGHEGEVPDSESVRQFCNLGYAAECHRLPHDRAWDAVRVGVTRVGVRGHDSTPTRIIHLRYVCERNHQPADHGLLQFDASGDRWLQTHPDHRVQRMAECVVQSQLAKTRMQMETVDPGANLA